MQHARGVRSDLDAGADLSERHRLLEHLHVEADTLQRQRRRQAADTTGDDGHGQITLAHRVSIGGEGLLPF